MENLDRNNIAFYKQHLKELYEKGHYLEAINIAVKIRNQIYRKYGKNTRDLAIILTDLAALYHVQDNYDKAEKLLQESIEIWHNIKGDNDPEFITSLANLAMVYYTKGGYKKAEIIYDEVLEIQPKIIGEDNIDYATNLSNMADIHCTKGDYDKAETMLLKAQEIWHRMKKEDDPYFAYSMNTLATVYYSKGDYDKAEVILCKVKDIWFKIQGKNGFDFALSLNNLGSLYYRKGNYHRAKTLLFRAASIQRKLLGENHLYFAISIGNIGEIYREIGDYANAKKFLLKALNIRLRLLGENHPDVAFNMNILALLFTTMGYTNKAIHFMKKAVFITDKMIPKIFSISSESTRMSYLNTLHLLFHSFLSLVVQYKSTQKVVLDEALGLVLRRKGIVAETLSTERAALMSDKYKELKPKIGLLNGLMQCISHKTLNGPDLKETLDEHQKILSKLETKKEKLEKELASKIPEMKIDRILSSANLHLVEDVLSSYNAILVEFVRIDLFDFQAVLKHYRSSWKSPRYVAFVLDSSNSNIHLIDLGGAEHIDLLVNDFILLSANGSERANAKDPSKMSREVRQDTTRKLMTLRKIIFEPLKKCIDNSRRLFIAPDGELNKLPFEILPTDDSGTKYLIDDYVISYVTSGRDLLRFGIQTSNNYTDPIVAVDPDFELVNKATNALSNIQTTIEEEGHQIPMNNLRSRGIHFSDLSNTRIEGELISDMLNVIPLVQDEVVESRIKTLKSPRILHIATHGFFFANNDELNNVRDISHGVMNFNRGTTINIPYWKKIENPLLRSGLALAGANTWARGGNLPEEAEDGVLTALDARTMDLIDTQLLVLSACDTGLGDVYNGEGVFGLRRSFVINGAQTLVMSLWKVPDKQTRELMVEFYRGLKKGKGRVEALREAQLEMKKKYPHPYYWGAFICQGNSGPLSNLDFVTNSL